MPESSEESGGGQAEAAQWETTKPGQCCCHQPHHWQRCECWGGEPRPRSILQDPQPSSSSTKGQWGDTWEHAQSH